MQPFTFSGLRKTAARTTGTKSGSDTAIQGDGSDSFADFVDV